MSLNAHGLALRVKHPPGTFFETTGAVIFHTDVKSLTGTPKLSTPNKVPPTSFACHPIFRGKKTISLYLRRDTEHNRARIYSFWSDPSSLARLITKRKWDRKRKRNRESKTYQRCLTELDREVFYVVSITTSMVWPFFQRLDEESCTAMQCKVDNKTTLWNGCVFVAFSSFSIWNARIQPSKQKKKTKKERLPFCSLVSGEGRCDCEWRCSISSDGQCRQPIALPLQLQMATKERWKQQLNRADTLGWKVWLLTGRVRVL